MTEEFVKSIVSEHWGITGQLKKLPGYEDLNYYLKSEKDESYLVKIYIGGYDDILDFQIKALQHIHNNIGLEKISVPSIIPSNLKQDYLGFELNNQEYILRIHTWVPGKLWVNYFPKNLKLLKDLGRKSGNLLKAFKGFQHNSMINRDFEWDLANSLWVESYLELLDSETKNIIEIFIRRFREIQDVYLQFPKMVIHNDINDYNIIVENELVSGIIDFGDMCYTQRINDLAILLAYAMTGHEDPLDVAVDIISGYFEVITLSEQEIDCLLVLAVMRLSVSVISAAINLEKNPENEYLQVTSKPAIALLKKLSMTSIEFASYKFKEAAGITSFSITDKFQKWVKNNQGNWSKVCPLEIGSDDYYVLDLNVGSKELGHEIYFNDPYKHEIQINKILDQEKKTFAIGKFDEVRPLYSSDYFVNIGNQGNRWRTVHLGLDFFHKAGTEVYAFCKGSVHSFQFNEGDKNYGNTVILRHDFEELTFYTLYGHLSGETLKKLTVNQAISQGQIIGWFGEPHENGNWAPHLHFQIILDMIGNSGDFPGVAYFNERNVYKSISPDPTSLFSIEITEKPKLDKDKILQKRRTHLGRSYSISYKDHLHIDRAHMQYLYDEKGRKFLDCVNNVPHVGHQNIKVLEAAQLQMALLNTNTRYLHDNIIELAENLISTLPEKLKVCHFVNSGSEANELALRMARTFTGRNDIVAMKHGYHGNTNLCIDVSSYKFEGNGGFKQKDYVHLIEMPDPFRGNHKNENITDYYSGRAISKVDEVISQKGVPAAFICESILSCGGQLCFPKGYLKEVYNAYRKRGIVIIADEVQTGLGRVGNNMWAFQNEEVVPDIVTIGKPFGNGHPIGAVVCTEEIADAFANGMEYFNTFGGNPVSCSIGNKVLNIVKEDALMEHALEIGNYIKDGFKSLKNQFPILGDVRGHGFFLGWEFIADENWTPDAAKADYFVNRAKDYGMLLSTDGPLHNVIKFKPPMIFTRDNADYLLGYSEKILNEDFMKI